MESSVCPTPPCASPARLATYVPTGQLHSTTRLYTDHSPHTVREIPQAPSSMFFAHNQALVPPYQLLIDTNFLSHSVSRKLELLEAAMSCLYAKVDINITSCVMAELEKLGPRYRIALRIARDERWKRLPCETVHSGTYADDCMSTGAPPHTA